MSCVRVLPPVVLLAILLLFAAPRCAVAQQKAYPDTEAAQHVGEDAAITGKVVAVSKSAKGTTFMNFGDKFPRNIFNVTIFASAEAKVGDVKALYEGKVVTVTGKIELGLDQKPQIIVKSPEQIKLADGSAPTAVTPVPPAAPTAAVSTPAPVAPKAPMPAPKAPMPAAVPVAPIPPTAALTPPVAPAPKPADLRKIVLAPNWNSPPQGGEMTRKDLASIFGGLGTPGDSADDATIMVYPEVPYLTPLATAKKRLQLEGTSDSVLKLTTSGLPIGSFSVHSFTGIFPGGFNRLNLITDLADQVVSVQLVDDNSRQRSSDVTDTTGYHTYNFVSGRSKGTNELVVKHQVVKEGAPKGVVVVETMLLDPNEPDPAVKGSSKPKGSSSSSSSSNSRTPKTAKVSERARWYVPGPVVSLILRCVASH